MLYPMLQNTKNEYNAVNSTDIEPKFGMVVVAESHPWHLLKAPI